MTHARTPLPNSIIEIGIVAGEASGDLHAGALIAELRRRHPEWRCFGCGGEHLRAAGSELLLDSRELSVLGLAEVVRHLPRIYGHYRRLWRAIAARRPQALILVDFPDFNLRLARRARQANIPVIYFISPQVWAWRPRRVRLLRRTVRRMICIFPFEPAFYQQHGMDAVFAGHPLLDRIPPPAQRSVSEQAAWRKAHGLEAATPVVALLPGSRRRELEYHLPVLLEAARRLRAERDVQFAIAAAPGLNAGEIQAAIPETARGFIRVLTGATYELLAQAEIAIVASGTATLEAGLLEVPMIVVYRLSPWTYRLGRRLVRTPYIAMANLVLGEAAVPELVQDGFTPEAVVKWARNLLDDPEARQRMREKLSCLRTCLGEPGAMGRAAAEVEAVIQDTSSQYES